MLIQAPRPLLRPSKDRGHTQLDWLTSFHTFSFGDYKDPDHQSFGHLRVINDDIIKANSGFGTHPHHDMEIITLVLSGQLEHKDSLGNGSLIQAGDVQRMTAGTGIRHSEFNPSQTQDVQLLQVWIIPHTKGLTPSYEQKSFSDSAQAGRWCLLASEDGREASVQVHQDVQLWGTHLSQAESVTYELESGRAVWLHVATGQVEVNGTVLEAGGAIGVVEPCSIHVKGLAEASKVFLFDLQAL
ncbi:MAG: pirin family protein [Vampirovibrionales bacterium]